VVQRLRRFILQQKVVMNEWFFCHACRHLSREALA
jgi:hypothetical protein